MRIVGIDPGKSGAFAALRPDLQGFSGTPAHVSPLPLVHSPKGRDEYSLRGIYALLVLGGHIFIERQQPIPAQVVGGAGGAITNYSLGYIQGVLEGQCAALGLPYELVTPRRWQAEMLDGIAGEDTKQRAVIAAQRLFPHVSLLRTERSRKLDSGFADALLIAEWGRRKLRAGASLVVLVAALLVGGCAARGPVVGPCTTTPCGDVCCNNDGKACPPCWVGIQGGSR
jgi:crossover junction endodeoxyribonuclease RuvC